MLAFWCVDGTKERSDADPAEVFDRRRIVVRCRIGASLVSAYSEFPDTLGKWLVLCRTLDFGCPGKGVRHKKCEAPAGPFRLLVTDPFSRPRFNPIFEF